MEKVGEFIDSFIKWVVIVLVGIASMYVICWIARQPQLNEDTQVVETKVETSEETDYNIEIVSLLKVTESPATVTYICPYCRGALVMHSGTTIGHENCQSFAQLYCPHCDFQTPEVYINNPEAVLEAEKLLTDKLKTHNWEEADFVGKELF